MNKVCLEKGIIYLMLPFRLDTGSFKAVVSGNDVWTRVNEDYSRFEFLLEHVREFFTRNNDKLDPDESACVILKLNKDALPVKLFNNRTYWISAKPHDSSKSPDKAYRLPVSFDPASFSIIYYPFAGIGILTYNVGLRKKV